MNGIDASGIDLNLLHVLQALLAEGSVTRAAHRLGVGQPAASHALGRLRKLFDDPLFVRAGRQMVPTPRAEGLREPLARLLADAGRLVSHEAPFEPARSARTFTLVCPDLLAPTLARIYARLAVDAPAAQLEVALPRPTDARALEEGRVDLALVPTPEEGPGLLRRALGVLRFAVVARRGHPLVGARRLTGAGWAAHPHVLVRTGHGSRAIVGTDLERARFQRRIGLVVPTFLAAIVAVAETDLFFTAPRELVASLVDRFALALLEPPLPLSAVPVSAVWHERFHAAPAACFFRDLVVKEIAPALRGRSR